MNEPFKARSLDEAQAFLAETYHAFGSINVRIVPYSAEGVAHKPFDVEAGSSLKGCETFLKAMIRTSPTSQIALSPIFE